MMLGEYQSRESALKKTLAAAIFVLSYSFSPFELAAQQRQDQGDQPQNQANQELVPDANATGRSANRSRLVSRPAVGTGVLTGRVTSAASGAGLSSVEIVVGGTSGYTDDEGNFELSDVTSGPQTMVVRRVGYLTLTRSVTVVPGSNPSLQLALEPGPVATLRRTNGTTHTIDVASTEFGVVITFVGYSKAPRLDFCPAGGGEVIVELSEIRSFDGPAVASGAGACCQYSNTESASVTRKDGSQVGGILLQTCEGYKMDVITYDRVADRPLYIPLREVAKIEFP
jgi:hypothetical protein